MSSTDTPTTPAESEWNESDLIMRFPPEVLKIVGKHSKFWNYDKSETLQKLDDWMQDTITKEKERAALKLMDTIQEILNMQEKVMREYHGRPDCKNCSLAETLQGVLEAKRKELS